MNTIDTSIVICIQYCVVSIVCIFSLIYFIIVTNRSAEHSSELMFYKLAMALAALCAITDIMYALREFGAIQLGSFVNYTGEILYSLGSICGAYCWFIYSEKKHQSRMVSTRGLLYTLAVPFVIMCLFTITTPLHKLCFSISGTHYVRGILNVPFTVFCGAFIIYSGISALISSFSKINHSKTVLLRMLFVYAIFFILAQVLQVIVGPILPFRSLAATVIFMFITLRGMCETVTVDALSGINNRFSFNRYLDEKIAGNEEFWLMMIDIDDFKHINDTFGHAVGDDAIRYTATAIARSVPRNCFVARYGGDEFAVVAPPAEESEIMPLEENIRKELKSIIQQNNSPLNIDITAGYAQRNESICNAPDMIEAADSILYDRKRSKKTS